MYIFVGSKAPWHEILDDLPCTTSTSPNMAGRKNLAVTADTYTHVLTMRPSSTTASWRLSLDGR